MKKICCIALALCLVLGLSLSAAAAEYANMLELLMAWEEEGYPEDVAGIYSTDGSAENLTVLLIGDTDGSRAAEIRAMLDDPSTVSFAAGSYSETDLQKIKEEIVAQYLTDGSGIIGCGVGWGNEGGFGESGNELRVVVQAEEDRAAEYAEMFQERYGDAVVVEAAQRPILMTDEGDLQLSTALPEASPENDVYGDLTDAPVIAPAPDEALAAPEENLSAAPAADAMSVDLSIHEEPEPSHRGPWVALCAAGAAVLLVLLVLLRRRKK